MTHLSSHFQSALARFRHAPTYRHFRALSDLAPKLDESSLHWRKLEDAIMAAAQADRWRLARAGLDEMKLVHDREQSKAEVIVRALTSRYESVRIAAWQAIRDEHSGLLVLDLLEGHQTARLMNFEIVMAIDEIALHLSGSQSRQRLITLVRRLERQGTRSPSLRAKIEDTLYCDLHLGVPRCEGADNAAGSRSSR